jgi:DNA replication licensing factor MCM4
VESLIQYGGILLASWCCQTVEREDDIVNIDMSNIFDHDPDLYAKIVQYPPDIIPLLDTECPEVAIDIRPDFEKHIEVRICA